MRAAFIWGSAIEIQSLSKNTGMANKNCQERENDRRRI